jgi:DNA-directed RNA polymerase specialized sigma24 family protein
MGHQNLYSEYFKEGTGGFAIIRRFYRKYADVLGYIQCAHINDVINEVFLSLTRTDFQHVKDEQHYVLRAIKLHCWSLLDRAIRVKALVQRGRETNAEGDIVGNREVPGGTDQHAEHEGVELLAWMNLFKTQVSTHEARLLNLLIDETPRVEIATELGLNMNTLDTHIRRLRMKLADYLKTLGYSYRSFERFEAH